MNVKIKDGELRGEIKSTKNEFKYVCFKGIPYAQPPVGDLRFKDPQKVRPWTGVKDVTVEGNVCSQKDFKNGTVTGDENCLFLNVYTPWCDSNDRKLAVMVWVHGGGFYKGSGNYESYGGDYLLEHNVVYVTINYRFGLFGFLCLDSEDVPGNAGLKDQILALQWVKENIGVFGGDPNNVTIFGESAGAASISFLSLSPLANNLFQKMIIQSGTSLCPWAMQDNPMKYLRKFAERFHIDVNNKYEILKYLQNMSVNDLLTMTSEILTTDDGKKYLPIAFLPVVEQIFPGVQSVINQHPEEIFKSGNFISRPTIAGYSSREGLFMMDKIGCDFKRVNDLVPSLEFFLPLKDNHDKDKVHQISRRLQNFYFNDQPINITQTNNVIDLLSDYLFRYPVDKNVKLLNQYCSAPVFYFQFSYQGNLSRDKKIFKELKLNGASHSEECGYIFRKLYLKTETPLQQDITIRNQMTTMWTNFAITGNPTPKTTELIPIIWKAVTADEINYLEIGQNLEMCQNPNADALNLWSQIHQDLNV